VLLVLRAISPDRSAFRDSKVAGAIVLISAHNEAGTIGDTVAALSSQVSEWPETRLWVIADRCSDRTADEATERGARIAVRQEGPIGKGAAIDWWISSFRAEWQETSAIVILDADSRLEQGSLRAIAAAIGDGAVAAQAFVKPQALALTGRLAGWSGLMQSIDESRRRMRFPVPLRGTGSASAGVLMSYPRLHAAEISSWMCCSSRLARRVRAWRRCHRSSPSSPVSHDEALPLDSRTVQVLGDYWREILVLFSTWAGCTAVAGAWLLLPLLFLRPKVALIGLG
jgi:glycosyltransferase involved in cell wall biosynthesis